MATATGKALCVTCGKDKVAFPCQGCAQNFCFNHLGEHRQLLIKRLDDLENERNLFRQIFSEQSNDPRKHSLIQQINQWENNSIHKIQHTAEEARQFVLKYAVQHLKKIEVKLTKLTEELREIREEDDFNEIHLNRLKEKLNQLEEQLKNPSTIPIKEENSPSFINRISVSITFASEQLFLPNIPTNTRWRQNGFTVAGGNGHGKGPNQIDRPWSVYVDDDQTIYVADNYNHRIVEWEKGAASGQVVAGGKGKGNQNDQLNHPANVIVDKKNDALIICDQGNRRVVRRPRRNGTSGETVISNVDCYSLSMDNDAYLYISDINKHEVRRWKMGEKNGTLVAGGNGKGDRFDQLSNPCFIFVDQDHSVYVSDKDNHRVMKWMKGAKEGIVVAGGQGQGYDLTQLSYPRGVGVDQLGTVYVAEQSSHRVTRWVKGARAGSVVVGGNTYGAQENQFNDPFGLSFDGKNNLYVVDHFNHRVQKFSIKSNASS